MTTPARDKAGRFVRSLRGAQRDAQACVLRAQGHSYREIADQLGYGNAGNAHRAVETALAETLRQPADEARVLMITELDVMALEAWRVLRAEHIMISRGKVVLRAGQPLPDHDPVLRAIDRLLKISERRSKLLGTDAPIRQEVLTISELDAQIRALETELGVSPGEDLAELEAELAERELTDATEVEQ